MTKWQKSWYTRGKDGSGKLFHNLAFKFQKSFSFQLDSASDRFRADLIFSVKIKKPKLFFPGTGFSDGPKMSDDDGSEILPLSLVVRKDKLEPKFEPRKRFKASNERVPLEGRAEEILVEIEPNIEDEEEILVGDEHPQRPDQVAALEVFHPLGSI